MGRIMSKANSDSYRILFAIHEYYDLTGQRPQLSDIIARSGISGIQAALALNQLVEADIEEGGPWIVDHDGFYSVSGVQRDGEASTGGYAAMENAFANIHLHTDVSSWKEEAILGITATGKESKINRAVLSTTSNRGGGKAGAEQRADRINRRFKEEEPEKGKVRICKSCGLTVEILEEAKKYMTTDRRKCKKCHAQAMKIRRAGKKREENN
jgi:hypothetical protein